MALAPAHLQGLFDHNLDAVIVVAADGVIQAANPAARDIFGQDAELLVGRSLRELVPEEDGNIWLDLVRRATLPPGMLFLSVHDKERRRVPVDLRLAVPEPEGARLLLLRDLRSIHSLQDDLEAARLQLSQDKQHLMLAALAGAAAHELNQPLTSVMGYAELLRRKIPDGDPMAEPIDVILSQAERMAELVRKIGRVSKFETKSYLMGARIVDLDRAGEDE